MELFSIIELGLILVGVAYLVYYYAQKKVGFHIKALAYLSWMLAFGFVFLVPLDVYFTVQLTRVYGVDPNILGNKNDNLAQQNSTNLDNDQHRLFLQQFQQDENQNNLRVLDAQKNKQGSISDVQDQDNLNKEDNDNQQVQQDGQEVNLKLKDRYLQYYDQLTFVWRFIWWLVFFMTWIILPFFQEYEDAGDFNIIGKAKTSIKNNLKLYALMAVLGIGFVTYLLASGTFTKESLAGFAIVLVNCFGLLLVVLLLGHGLVALPKKYWLEKNNEVNLKYCYFQASSIENDLQDAQYKLEDEVKLLQSTILKHPSNDHIQHLKDILNKVPEYIVKGAKESRNQVKCSDHIDEQKVIKLHKKMKDRLANLDKLQSKFDSILDRAFQVEDIMKCQNNHSNRIQGVFWVKRKGTLGGIIDQIYWVWYTKLQYYGYIFMAILFSLFSLTILVGELSIFTNFSRSTFAMLLDRKLSYLTTQIYILIPLLYITFCVYYGLFNMKISGFFGFYKDQNTDGTSLMFGSINFLRVSAPICFNFLQMIEVGNTPFNQVMGDSNTKLLPIAGFIFPIILIILSCFNVFDIYKKIMTMFGFQQFSFSNDFSDEGIDDGKKIISRMRLQKEKEFMDFKSHHSVKGGYNSVTKIKKQILEDGGSVNAGGLQLNNIEQNLNNSYSANSHRSSHDTQNSSQQNQQQQSGSYKPAMNNNYYNFSNNQNFDQILNI